MPKVSVIVPNYNHAAYLNERINSILSQTFKDFEIILMDDNSSDNSRQIIETYRSLPNVKIVFNEVNSGTSFKQWNKGVRLSSGKYIWIAESDDIADKEFLETLVQVLDNNPGVALVYTQSYEINSKGYITGTWFDHTKMLNSSKWASDFIMQGNEMIKNYMMYHNCVPNASGVLFRRDKMETIGMADETFKLNGDWLFWIKLMEDSTAAFVAKSLNCFRAHEKSVRNLTLYTGLRLYEYSRIIGYISEHMKFNQQEKKEMVVGFYSRSKWSPTFYSWKLEPEVLRNIRKSYINLTKQDKIGLILYIKHTALRVCFDYRKAFFENYFKKPVITFFHKKVFPNSPIVKRIVIGIRNGIFGNPYGRN